MAVTGGLRHIFVWQKKVSLHPHIPINWDCTVRIILLPLRRNIKI